MSEGRINPQVTDLYVTNGGVRVTRTIVSIPVAGAIEPVVASLDAQRGVVLASSYEYPGRYTRWDMGFMDPPVELRGHGRSFTIRALNDRGRVLVRVIERALHRLDGIESLQGNDEVLTGTVAEPTERVPEEQRSRRPTLFTVLRALVDLFG
jgi:anthranilate synthase